MGGLESLSRAVLQRECGGWARLYDLLMNYILFLRFYVPGRSPMARSRFTSYLLLCSGMLFSTSTASSPSFLLGQRRVFALGSGVHGAVLCVRFFICDLGL